ncbi:MAG TPA: MFS transporter, partial [Gammaproteobacteria bacterium]|nr:MFS transporter [Gammaproteobacteria bacterium]
TMIFRFSLYGFLKNQRYFEPFLFLAFLEKGLDFTDIGLLIAVRELTTNLLEIPSGAVADVISRRFSMILSFGAYIVAFTTFGYASDMNLLYLGMLFFGVGEAFRSGTHKAMIFAWLRSQGREDERVKIYGYTRSWSKYGSAVSVALAAPIVLFTDSYEWIFLAAIVPYALNIVNFLGYPKDLDETDGAVSIAEVVRHAGRTVSDSVQHPRLRRLFFESMGFDGVFAATKDYLQPILAALALTLAVSWITLEDWSETQQAALLVGPVYIVLHLLSGAASRRSHQVSDRAGSEDRAARWLWGISLLVFAGLTISGFTGLLVGAVVAFVALNVLHNLWRPVLISRFDTHGSAIQGASLLSVESQARRVATMIMAPILGYGVDAAIAADSVNPWWPVGALGLLCSILFFAKSVMEND